MLDAIDIIRTMNTDSVRKVPTDAPTGFIKKRWKGLVFTDAGIDRRYYEMCALSELKNALRYGDIWVQGSRQFKNFDEYLVHDCARLTHNSLATWRERAGPSTWRWISLAGRIFSKRSGRPFDAFPTAGSDPISGWPPVLGADGMPAPSAMPWGRIRCRS